MSTQGNNDIGDLLGLGRAHKAGEQTSPLALDLFSKHGKTDGKTDKDGKAEAPEQKQAKEQEKSRQDEIKQTAEVARAKEQANLNAQNLLQQQFILETRAQFVQTLLATLMTSLQARDFQPAGQAPQAPVKIPELGKAPQEVHNTYAAKLQGQAVELEDLAKVHAWRAFNGTDILSTPSARFPADERLAALGQQLVEMKSLIDFAKPINATPQLAWTKDIQNITHNKTEALPVEQGRWAQMIIDRKVQTLQYILSNPVEARQIRNLKDDAKLSEFLTKTEAKLFPTKIIIPAEIMAAKPALPANVLDAAFVQKARAIFPADDALSAVGRQVSIAQSYLSAGKVNEAKAVLDPAKLDPAKAGIFADWLKPIAAVANSAQLKIAINDKFEAVKQTTRTAAGQEVPVDMISTKFLDMMQAGVSSARTRVVPPIETEAVRTAVLQLCQNPNTIEHVLRGLPEDQIAPTVQQLITTMATGIAQQLPFTDRRYQGTKLARDFEQTVADKVKEVTFPARAAAVIPPPAPQAMPPTTRLDNSSPVLAQKQKNVQLTASVNADTVNQGMTHGKEQFQATDTLASSANIAPGVVPLEQGASLSAPPEIPQFSMSTLNGLMSTVAHLGENWAQSRLVNFIPLAHLANDFAKQAPLLTVSLVDNMSSAPAVINTGLTDSINSVVSMNSAARNNDSTVSYSSISIPSPFEVPSSGTVLTGRGLDATLDGANRGPMAIGPNNTRSNTRSSNSGVMSRWSPSLASSNWTASSGGAVYGSSNSVSGGNTCSGGNCSSSGGRSSSGGGSAFGLPFHFPVLPDHGFTLGLKRGGFAVNGMGRAVTDKNKDNDDDDDDDDDKKKMSPFYDNSEVAIP